MLGSIDAPTATTTSFTEFTLSQSIANFRLLKLIYSYYSAGNPQYGSSVFSVPDLRAASNEAIQIYAPNVNKIFSIKYVNDTTLSARINATGSKSDVLAVMAIL